MVKYSLDPSDVIKADLENLLYLCITDRTHAKKLRTEAKRLMDQSRTRTLGFFSIITNCMTCGREIIHEVGTIWKRGSPISITLHDDTCPVCNSKEGFTYNRTDCFRGIYWGQGESEEKSQQPGSKLPSAQLSGRIKPLWVAPVLTAILVGLGIYFHLLVESLLLSGTIDFIFLSVSMLVERAKKPALLIWLPTVGIICLVIAGYLPSGDLMAWMAAIGLVFAIYSLRDLGNLKLVRRQN